MTIGPEPMRRMVSRSVRFGIDDSLQCLIQRFGRPPPGRARQLGRVTYEVRDVPTSGERGVRDRLDLGVQQASQSLEQLPYGHTLASSDVVRFSRNAAL